MYNIIAYISLVIAWILLSIAMLDVFNLYDFSNIQIKNALALIAGAFITMYFKIHTIPITQFIKEYWNKINNKNNDELNIKSSNYEEYKKQKEE